MRSPPAYSVSKHPRCGLARLRAAGHVVRAHDGGRVRAPVLRGGRGDAQVHVLAPDHVVHLRPQPAADRGGGDLVRVHGGPHAREATVRRTSVVTRSTL